MDYSDSSVLIVDDIEENVRLLCNVLETADIQTRGTTSPKLALQSAKLKQPDLILLDVRMPELDGYALCRKLKKDPATSKIPIIFISGLTDSGDLVEGFEAGGIDYITKPFRTEEILSRVKTQLRLRSYEVSLENQVKQGMETILSLNEEIESTQRDLLLIMGTIAEGHSKEVGLHVKRVAVIAYELAIRSGASEEEAGNIFKAAPLHDLGKIAIPDAVLHKPGKFNDDEWKIMKTHADLGYQMLNVSKRPLLQTAALIAREHHEKWDGSGYPKGLKGEEISLAGRVTAIADVFDALANKRCYKEAWSIEDTMNYLLENKRSHFDPSLIDLFVEQFDEIYDAWKDVNEHPSIMPI